jgi:hypothetical protein
LKLFPFFNGGLSWFDVAANEDTIDSFVVQAFFLLVQEREQKLEKNILQQISQVDWSCLYRVSPSLYAINFTTFMQKV